MKLATALVFIAVLSNAQTRDGMAEVPGTQLFYRDSGGSGDAVIFLHSATGHSQVWEYQIPAFTAAGYRFIAYDRRGWGRSVIKENTSTATGSDDLLALMDHLKINRAHIVATAAGGFVALDFALSFPQRVRGLVIANSIGGVQDPEYLELGRKLRPSPQFDALPPELRELGPAYRSADPAGTERWIQFEKTSRPEGPRAPAQAMRNKVTLSLLETLKPPALFITGGADMYMPPAVMRLLSARVKGSELSVIPDAGHSAYWEQPEVFNRTVIGFLKKH
jgi:pimeloyl-ACP methyl ester carboxylesterase